MEELGALVRGEVYAQLPTGLLHNYFWKRLNNRDSNNIDSVGVLNTH